MAGSRFTGRPIRGTKYANPRAQEQRPIANNECRKPLIVPSLRARLALPGDIHQGGHMPRKPPVTVEPRPDGRRAVQTGGTKRADSLHERKVRAVQRGRELA